MDDTGQNKVQLLKIICVWMYLTSDIVLGDIIVQAEANCGSLRYPIEKTLNDRNEEVITSHEREFYLPRMDCVISLLGRANYQFEVTLEFLQLDRNAVLDPTTKEPIKCHDYLKIYDSPRVDHAKLLTGPAGLCGNVGTLPQKRTFTTSCPFLAIEFVTDSDHEAYRGFNLRVIQYPWRNPGDMYPGAGLVPGASWSCYYSEFQPGWDHQSDSLPGNGGQGSVGGVDWDKSPNGVNCYVCSGSTCQVDSFDHSRHQDSTYAGCYRCSKIYELGRGDSSRRCYSQSDFLEFIESQRDSGINEGFLGCKNRINEYKIAIRYCFCDEDYCNSAPGKHLLIPLTAFITVSSILHQIFF